MDDDVFKMLHIIPQSELASVGVLADLVRGGGRVCQRFRLLGAGCWEEEVGFVSDFGCWVLGAGSRRSALSSISVARVLGAGCWVLGAGCRVPPSKIASGKKASSTE